MSRERTIFHRYDSRCEGMIITVQRRIESSPCDFEKQTIRAEQILLSKQYDGRNVIVTNKVTLRIYYRSKIYMKSESIIISYYQNKCLINNYFTEIFNQLLFQRAQIRSTFPSYKYSTSSKIQKHIDEERNFS